MYVYYKSECIQTLSKFEQLISYFIWTKIKDKFSLNSCDFLHILKLCLQGWIKKSITTNVHTYTNARTLSMPHDATVNNNLLFHLNMHSLCFSFIQAKGGRTNWNKYLTSSKSSFIKNIPPVAVMRCYNNRWNTRI